MFLENSTPRENPRASFRDVIIILKPIQILRRIMRFTKKKLEDWRI